MIYIVCAAMTVRGVSEDLNAKIHVNIKKWPILNNGMDVWNIGIDCRDPSTPNSKYTVYVIRKLINIPLYPSFYKLSSSV